MLNAKNLENFLVVISTLLKATFFFPSIHLLFPILLTLNFSFLFTIHFKFYHEASSNFILMIPFSTYLTILITQNLFFAAFSQHFNFVFKALNWEYRKILIIFLILSDFNHIQKVI